MKARGRFSPSEPKKHDPGFIRHFGQAVEGAGFAYLTAVDHILGAESSRFEGPVGGFPSAPYLIDHTFHEVLSLFSFLAGGTERIVFRPRVLILPQRSAVLAANGVPPRRCREAVVVQHPPHMVGLTGSAEDFGHSLLGL
ncbi:MAG: hypothetical protein OEY70_06750 [Acidimicrobiia bacterium]|nr:hypothetical protein [Acidimicrobiia bacterium]